MATLRVRVLVVDDVTAWRRCVRSILKKVGDFEIIGEAEDGAEAVQQAKELQPDLILLDVGLPILNGLDAAQCIHKQVPNAKILFVSANHNADIAIEALRRGSDGYIVKSQAATELIPAIEAVLHGKQFVSAELRMSGVVEHRAIVNPVASFVAT